MHRRKVEHASPTHGQVEAWPRLSEPGMPGRQPLKFRSLPIHLVTGEIDNTADSAYPSGRDQTTRSTGTSDPTVRDFLPQCTVGIEFWRGALKTLGPLSLGD